MNNIANRQIICDTLMELAETDKDIVVLCSDSRGSGSMTEFAYKYPSQFIEVGVAEQSLVSIAAGLASTGKKPAAISPASFLSTRSMEQIKVDCAYSNTNVLLVGISGGVSYGALGMTHHSGNDIACMASIPGMRVYLPSDRFQTEKLARALMKDKKPAYIRIGRNAVDDIYNENDVPFIMDQATFIKSGGDLAIIACGETVACAVKAAEILEKDNVRATVIDMYCVKPIDKKAVLAAAKTGIIITVEEHVAIGGMGSMVSQIVAESRPCKVVNLTLPDSPVISGKSKEVFTFYGIDETGIVNTAKDIIK